jgi:microcystin-dependent protein
MPPFHLFCDGNLYDRFIYPELFAAIEYDWGGDGIQFFRVPDGRGGFLRGVQDITAKTFTFDSTTDVCTTSSPHEFNRSGIPVKLTTTGTFPPEITADATYGYPVQRLYGPVYWVIWLSATTFQLAASHSDAIAGTFINVTTNGTGVHTVHPWLDPDALTREASSPGGATGNNSGTEQDHAVQDHSHADFYKINNFADSSNSGGSTPGSDAVRYDGNIQTVQQPLSNFSNETRPRNIGVNFIIKY